MVILFCRYVKECPENTWEWVSVSFFSPYCQSLRGRRSASETYRKMWQDFYPPLSGFLNKPKTYLSISVFDGGRENLRAEPWGKQPALGHPLVISVGRQAKTSVFECIHWQTTNGAVLQGCVLNANLEQGPLPSLYSITQKNICIDLLA